MRGKFLLNGIWKFRMDPAGKGVHEAWYSHPDIFDQQADVPASIQSQNIGMDRRYTERITRSDHESFAGLDPQYLTTKTECYLQAWYTRTVHAPAFEEHERVYLCFDSVSPDAVIYFDEKPVATFQDGLLQCQRVDVTEYLGKEKEHQITVHLLDTGFMTQGVVKWPYFTGILRDVYFEVREKTEIEDVFVNPDYRTGNITVRALIKGNTPQRITFEAFGKNVAVEGVCGQNCYITELSCSEWKNWTPDTPELYECTVCTFEGEKVLDERIVRFGFKRLETRDGKLFLNGEQFYLRGTGFAGTCFGMNPGKSMEWYQKLVRRIKEYGFNYLRLHTTSMESELLDICDEEGLLVQSELFSVLYESQNERALTERQCELMLRRNRNHPCIGAWVMGNEHDHASPLYLNFRDALCKKCRAEGPNTLVIDADGTSPTVFINHEQSDVALTGATDVGNILDLSPQIQGLAEIWKGKKPYLLHEFNYTESFPRVFEKQRYQEALRPFWLEHAEASAREHGMESLLNDFVAISEKFHYRQIRRAMEDVRKTPNVSGFGHWGFVDHVHESIGLLNMFLEDKGGCAEDFRQVNSDIVLALTTADSSYTAHQGKEFEFDISICSVQNQNLSTMLKLWIEVDETRIDICSKKIKVEGFGIEKEAGSFLPPAREQPYKCILHAELEKTTFCNSWELWFFPERRTLDIKRRILYLHEFWPTLPRVEEFIPGVQKITEYALWEEPSDAILIAPVITPAVTDYLRRGGDVLLSPVYYTHGNPGLPTLPASYAPMPSFAGTEGACGTVVSEHPLTNGFPHDGFCDMQFFDLIGGERSPHVCTPFHHITPPAFNLDAWPVRIEPIIRSIPNWKNCRNRAYLFEVCVGEGRLLANEMSVIDNLFHYPEAEWWMDAMIAYMNSDAFTPKAHVSVKEFEKICVPVGIIRE